MLVDEIVTIPIMFKARIVSEKFSCIFHNDVLIVILDHNTLWSRHYVQVIFFICLTIFLLMKKVVLCIDGNNKHTSCADGAMVACIIDSVLAGRFSRRHMLRTSVVT